MRKNVSSQIIGAQLVSATDGSNFTGTVTAYVCGDNGTQTLGSVGSGVCTHKGNGFHIYTPAASETNYDHIAYTFIGTGAVTSTIQVYTTEEIAQTVWGSTMSSYTTVDTFGKELKELSQIVVDADTAQNGGTNNITLSASASAYNVYDPGVILITGGTGAGQSREIIDYNTSTKVATVSRSWKVVPDNTSTYIILTAGAVLHSNEGLAQAGSSTTITLNATGPSGDDSIVGQTVWITAGTGQDQANTIASYNGTTKVATMSQAWVTTPDATSIYSLLPFGASVVFGYQSDQAPLQPTTAGRTLDVTATGAAGIDWGNIENQSTAVNLSATNIDVDQVVASVSGAVGSVTGLTNSTIADQVWDEAIAGHLTAGSTGAALNAAGSAGDPWTTSLPGAYGAGTAGYIIGTNLDGTVSSRASQTSLDTLDNYVDTEIADIQSRLPASLVGGRMDCSVGAMAANTLTASALATDAVTEIQSGLATSSALTTVEGKVDTVDTVVDAIKLKTDNLPAAPAAVGDIPTATQNADALLNRDMSAVSDTNSRSPLNALRFLRNKWSVSGTTLTVTKEDDATTAFTATVSTNASADPITGSDPS